MNLVWTPKDIEQTKMMQFMHHVNQTHSLNLRTYHDLHAWSITHSALFWASLQSFLPMPFKKKADQIRSTNPHMMDVKWFQGAQFNFAEILLQHADPQHMALICYDETGPTHSLNFQTLRQAVADCAAGMQKLGIQTGSRVAGVLGNTHYAVIAMLATASLGAIWSACAPEFGSDAILERLQQIEPSLLFITDDYSYQGKRYCMAEKIAAIQQKLLSVKQIVRCKDWEQFLIPHSTLSFDPQPFGIPLYILFSSGTTGKPKCIVHSAGGTLLQHLKELALHTNLSNEDTLFFYTTCGWMMWNWMVSALALGTTLVLYDGSPVYPNSLQLFHIIDANKVTVFGTSAKYLANLEHLNESPRSHFELQSLKTILSTGSPLLPNQYDFVHQHIGSTIQLSSISGGTDIIACFALGNPILPVYRGELQCIGLGFNVKIFNAQGQAIEQETGELVCVDAFPSMPLGFWNDPDRTRYHAAYFSRFENVWYHGDFAKLTSHQGLIIYGRSDATLNPGGIRIGTVEIYRPLEQLSEIQDSLVVEQAWEGDTRIILFVVLKPGYTLDKTLKMKIQKTIREQASPRHVPRKIIAVPDLPRTMNGKPMELVVKQIIHDQPILQLSSIANPECLDYFKKLSIEIESA